MSFEVYNSNVTEESKDLLDEDYEPMTDYWDGNNIICCKGSCGIGGPPNNIPVIVCVMFIIGSGGGLYFYFVAPFLWKNVSEAIPIIWSVIYVCLLVSYFLTMCTDPGIIPRRKWWELIPDSLNVEDPNIKKLICDEEIEDLVTADYTDHDSNSKRVWCQSCQIYRPPRASHCAECDNCVEVMDHHCPFVGNCVAKRNYQYFCSFIVLVIVGISTLMIQVGYFMYASHSLDKNHKNDSIKWVFIIIGIFIAAPLVIFLIFVSGLGCFHCCLKCTGRTTREFLKNKQDVIGDSVDNDWFTRSNTMIDYTYKLTGYQAERLDKWDHTKSTFRDVEKNHGKYETKPEYAKIDNTKTHINLMHYSN